MNIRVATEDDLPRILDLGELLHNESPRWSRISFSRRKSAAMLSALIESSDGVIYVAVEDGIVVGGIAGVIEPHWSSEDRLATEVSLFMAPEARGKMTPARLICVLDAWAKKRGAVWINGGTSTGLNPERTAGLYEAVGWERCAIGLEKYYGS